VLSLEHEKKQIIESCDDALYEPWIISGSDYYQTSMRKRIVINDDMTTSFWYDWKKPMIASLCLNIGLGFSVVYMTNIPEKI
jgi:hypothetical protein